MSKWILCSQELPEEKTEVFLVDKNNCFRKGEYRDKTFQLSPIPETKPKLIKISAGDTVFYEFCLEKQIRSLPIDRVVCWQKMEHPLDNIESPFNEDSNVRMGNNLF